MSARRGCRVIGVCPLFVRGLLKRADLDFSGLGGFHNNPACEADEIAGAGFQKLGFPWKNEASPRDWFPS
jgi:hypothetical protein